ncbi:Crp/Fnr family transcriptional regulator [bacterium]|nr:MAG: Crp/Fnr family transcriptional regulator [bacterium]
MADRTQESGKRLEDSELISCCLPAVGSSLLAAGKKRQHRKDALIFAQGDPATSVMLIETGSAVWFRESIGGRRLIVKLEGPGQSLGLPAVVAGSTRLVSAAALEPLTVVEIPSSAILDVMLRDAAMATRIARIALEDYMKLLAFVMEVTFHPVSHRILRLLLRLEEQGRRLDVTLRHRDFADMVATTRETFTAQLGALERSGLIARSGHDVYIINPSVVRTMVEEPYT